LQVSGLLIETEKADTPASEEVDEARKVAAVFTSEFVEGFE
jgi:hypothetical protein